MEIRMLNTIYLLQFEKRNFGSLVKVCGLGIDLH